MLTLDTDRDVAERSILIKNLLEDVGDEAMTDAVPLPNVSTLPPLRALHNAYSVTLGQRCRSSKGDGMVHSPPW